MVHGNELALELADSDLVAVGDDPLRHAAQVVFSQLFREQRQGQLGPDQRDVSSLAEQVWHGADVVFMTVGEHQADHIVEPLADGIEARQDQVDAGMIILGEQHSAVNQQQLAVEFDDCHVAPDISQTAQGDDAHRIRGQQGRNLQATGSHGRKGYRPDSIAAVGAASGEPLAASVRLAWPDEAPNIASLQRRSWAVQWPADLAELMLNSVSLADMVDTWRRAIEKPPEATFRVLVATDGQRVVGIRDHDAEPG